MIKKKITKKIACPKCGKIVDCKGLPGEKKIIICSECHTKGFFSFPEVKTEKIEEKVKRLAILQIPYIIVVILILVAHFIFYNNDMAIFLSFMLIIPFFVFLEFDSRILIGYAVLMLALSIIILGFIDNEIYVNQLSTYAYWLLVAGFICITIDYFRK